MAIKLIGRQDDDSQTTRVVYSRNGSKALCELYLNSRPCDSRPGYNLHDQVCLYVARCQLFNSLQQLKLTRHQDISAVALEHHKRQNVTTSHSTLARGDDPISPYLFESQSTTFNSQDGNSCLQSTSMPLTLSLCDSEDTKRATEHPPKVCESLALTNAMRMRSNSCRNNKPALKDKNSQLRPTRRRPVSYRRQRQDQSLGAINDKLTLPGKPNFGKSASHDRSLLTMRSAINSCSTTGDMEDQEEARNDLTSWTHTAGNDLTSSTHTARTLPAPNMPWGNSAEVSVSIVANL